MNTVTALFNKTLTLAKANPWPTFCITACGLILLAAIFG